MLLCSLPIKADVVKPALIEIVANQNGELLIDARVSIEALLSEINGQYKNTKDAPTAAEYDEFREMSSPELKTAFEQFHQQFLNSIEIKTDKGISVPINLSSIKIPEPGYTKVPRISILKLRSEVHKGTSALTWYYPARFGDNAVRLKQVDEARGFYHWSEWQWIRNDVPSQIFSLSGLNTKRAFLDVTVEYIKLGFLHILPKGLDHILFILGLFFLAVSMKGLVWQITMFTVAHSLTLGLSILGWVSLPAQIVEPLIALSIVYIGIENLLIKQVKVSRLFIVFLFGLLHGLGFASVLKEFGMPNSDLMTALLSFNIGVELGQLTIVLLAIILVSYWFGNKRWYRASIARPASLLIAIVGLYWFVQRLDLNFI